MFEDSDPHLTETYGDIPTMFDLHSVSMESLKQPPVETYVISLLWEVPLVEFHYKRNLWDMLTGKPGKEVVEKKTILQPRDIVLSLTNEQVAFFIHNRDVILQVAGHGIIPQNVTFKKHQV